MVDEVQVVDFEHAAQEVDGSFALFCLDPFNNVVVKQFLIIFDRI